MPGKLNQIIAVVAGKKSKATATLTEIYHKIQKTALFDGISRVYQPRDEEGEKLPAEAKPIQVKVGDLINEAIISLIDMYDIVATQDYANCTAKADVVVRGKTVLQQVPVTHLLFLEKQLVDVTTFISKLPVLDPAEEWRYDSAVDQYVTKPSESARTKKIPKAFVKYEATKEHPAQVETFNEDVLVGYWRTIKMSGAIPAKQKNTMLEKARLLHEAVVKAREEANSIPAPDIHIGKAVFDYILT